MNPLLPIVLGILLVVLLLAVRWKWRVGDREFYKSAFKRARKQCGLFGIAQTGALQSVSRSALQDGQSLQLAPKDSIDDHLSSLTKKLAEKEGRLRLSKSKIHETQCEIENLHAVDVDVRDQYKEVMDSLRTDLVENERECKRLQEQIEWVSRRRAEIRDDVRRGQKLYGEAAAELANNLAELRRGRAQPGQPLPQPQPQRQQRQQQSWCHTRHRAEPSFNYIRPMYYPAIVKTD